MRERLPAWYGDQGFVDFQVTQRLPDAPTRSSGKAMLHLTVDEGQPY